MWAIKKKSTIAPITKMTASPRAYLDDIDASHFAKWRCVKTHININMPQARVAFLRRFVLDLPLR
jgi:hypothetical protein